MTYTYSNTDKNNNWKDTTAQFILMLGKLFVEARQFVDALSNYSLMPLPLMVCLGLEGAKYLVQLGFLLPELQI